MSYTYGETVLVGWQFPTTNSLIASQGIAENTHQSISINGSAEISGFVAGSISDTYAPSANGWDGGSGSNYWLISFSSENYTNLTLSSRMSGSSTGPKDFQVQYRVDTNDWANLVDSNATISISTDNSWPAGTISDVPLPATVENQPVVSLRWLMTSENSIGGGTVASTGTSRMDDIAVKGTVRDDLPAPLVPSVLPASNVKPDQFIARWSAVTGNVAGYELEVATSDQFRRIPSVLVDFEGTNETKTSYGIDTNTLSGLSWELNAALIGTTTSDFRLGERSLRLRGYAESAVTLLDDLSNGLQRVSFAYRRYGADSQVAWVVETSTNQGGSWQSLGAPFTAPDSDAVQLFSETVNIDGVVRVRIRQNEQSGSSNKRLNIDDIRLFDVASIDDYVVGYDPLYTVNTAVLLQGLPPDEVRYYRVRTVGIDDTFSGWSDVQRVSPRPPTVVILF